jgi:hypothetical protein
VKYVSGDKEGNNAIAKLIAEKYGRVDTVIASAGTFKLFTAIPTFDRPLLLLLRLT